MHHPASRAVLRRQFRPVIFGVEQALLSTLGVTTAVETATHSRSLVLLIGLILVTVQAMSLAVTENLLVKAELKTDGLADALQPFVDAGLLVLSYIVASALILVPYIVFQFDTTGGLVFALLLSLPALFLTGVWKNSQTYGHNELLIVAGLELVLLGAGLAAAGWLIGNLVLLTT